MKSIKILLKKIRTAFFLILFNPKSFRETIISYLKIGKMKLLTFFYCNKLCSKKLTGDIVFEIDFALDSFIAGEIFLGDYEREIVKVLRKFLKTGSTFIDVGSNIGYLSAIGLGCVGKSGQVHCFEPVPRYYNKLCRIPKINKDYTILLNNCAVGEVTDRVKINICKINCNYGKDFGGIGMNSIVPGFIKNELVEEVIEVDIIRLDDYVKKYSLNKIGLIKIDVEGYEFNVLKGLENFFNSKNNLPPILCEIIPKAYSILGYSINDLFEYMANYSYSPVYLDNFSVSVAPEDLFKKTDVLFLQKS